MKFPLISNNVCDVILSFELQYICLWRHFILQGQLLLYLIHLTYLYTAYICLLMSPSDTDYRSVCSAHPLDYTRYVVPSCNRLTQGLQCPPLKIRMLYDVPSCNRLMQCLQCPALRLHLLLMPFPFTDYRSVYSAHHLKYVSFDVPWFRICCYLHSAI